MTKNRAIFKWVAIGIATFVAIVVVALSVVLNFIVTPEKMTPIINEELGKLIKGKANIERVDVSLFSSFPNVALELDSLTVVDAASRPIVKMGQLRVAINPYLYLLNKEVAISEVTLIEPTLTLAKRRDGSLNFDILEQPKDTLQTTTEPKDTTSASLRDYISSIDVNSVKIERGKLSLIDAQTRARLIFDSLNLDLDGHLARQSRLKMDFECANASYIRNRVARAKDIRIAITADLEVDLDSMRLRIMDGGFDVGRISLRSSGELVADTLKNELYTDLNFSLAAQSLSNLISRIPKRYINVEQKFSADGTVELGGSVKGVYNGATGRIPSLDLLFKINNGRFKFDDMPYGVDTLSVEARAKINGDTISKSTLEIDKIRLFSLSGVDIDSFGTVRDPLGEYRIDANVDCDINISSLRKVLPISEGIELEGYNQTKLRTLARKKDIENRNYGAIYLRGSSQFKDLRVAIDGNRLFDTTAFNTYLFMEMKDGVLNFGSTRGSGGKGSLERNLSADIAFQGLGFKNKRGLEIFLSDIQFKAASKFNRDTTVVTPIDGELIIERLSAGIKDTLNGKIQRSTVKFSTRPSDEDKSKPHTVLSLKADSLTMDAIPTATNIGMAIAGFRFDLTPDTTRPRGYSLTGTLGFGKLSARSDMFPLDFAMPGSKVTLDNRRIELNATHMQVGESSIVATGWVENILGRLLKTNQEEVVMDLSLKSQFINLTELYNASMLTSEKFASSEPQQIVEQPKTEPKEQSNITLEPIAADTLSQMQLVELPKGIRAKLNVNFDKLSFMERDIENLRGVVELSDNKLRLNRLQLLSHNSRMTLSALYNPISDSLAHTLVSLRAKRIVLGDIVEMVPSIDTLMPALKSLQGVVDFDMVAKGEFDKSMTFVLPSVESVMNFTGQDLVLLDGETFATVAKMLRFKNRERNLIDSLNMNVVVHKGGQIDVPPFEFEMDRYRAIIGGTQVLNYNTFDITYDYNVSIIKSPIIIKAGVDITGTNGDFDYDITKAKLKKSDFDEIQLGVDDQLKALRDELWEGIDRPQRGKGKSQGKGADNTTTPKE